MSRENLLFMLASLPKCVVPDKMGIGVYGPALNRYGNSLAGISVLKELSNKLNLSVL